MSKELIVATNPARRKRRSSPKQRAAARRNIKKAQAARRRKPRRNPSSPTATRSVARAYNPRRRRASSSSRRRRNPVKIQGLVQRSLIPAAVGGGGAVLNDVLFNFLPLPAMLKAGPMRHAAKAATAIGLAYIASFAVNRRTADQLGAGALTVVGYNVVRELAARFMPTVQMGMYLDPNLGYYGAGLDPSFGMGEYLTPGLANIPGAGVGMPSQLSQGTPYMGAGGWPNEMAGGDYEYEYVN